MADLPRHTAIQIEQSLELWLEVEFTFLHVDKLAATLSELPREDQDFLLNWIRRIATTNIEIAHQFGQRVMDVLSHMDRRVIEAWALHTMDTYDRSGLRPALLVVQDAENFVHLRHERVAGAVYEDVSGILLTFVRGLSGRQLKMEQGETLYTDTETLYLPAVVAKMHTTEDNFQLCKAMVAYLWAQTRYGTFRVNLTDALSHYSDNEKALKLFHALETLRLDACISRELPGLFREMKRLRAELGEIQPISDKWADYTQELAKPTATANDCLRLLVDAYTGIVPDDVCYQGELKPEVVAACMSARMEREKMLLRVKLAEFAKDLTKQNEKERESPPNFDVKTPDGEEEEQGGITQLELTLDDMPIAPPEGVRQLLTSIQLDWGEIPPECLTAAGEGEYDPSLYQEQVQDPDAVWQGTYHEEGATFYSEWDCGRQHYRKNWCVMREKDVLPVYDNFVPEVLQKYNGLVKHLRRVFEAMRDENRLLKRQVYGDEVDIDALVEALADARDGSEMSDHLFMRMHRTERNIAVIFMVDMSGSTKGWINDAERESLVLLCETLETLGDRYAIYGFSGITRKRCELYRIKRIDEPYNEEVKARISGIRPQDYTRMGFAIRHLTHLLNEVEAKTKLLITLSDGKPDDYFDGYRGEYGFEDTRKALQEAQRSGIHPFCITIDTEARDYLPHMYGAVNYTVIDDVKKLPLKVADIYRRLTT
ncbi:nitric oxide reductase activation protein NorD [Sulfurirhabdus autotrophica]|uniref:Nitric oxide reductase NorD protein n=1 Tax=Sulfurirhabdus autotrophica TaxID=1706046 RepID=A0A4R3XRE5_9PROT|nr:VWA domain-containing protein [Sulfurirhabdus autotrophica]TCV79120.1 nitric oxide reductase NorD protein [Sulfurirhabdus autotrophica]